MTAEYIIPSTDMLHSLLRAENFRMKLIKLLSRSYLKRSVRGQLRLMATGEHPCGVHTMTFGGRWERTDDRATTILRYC